MKKGNCIKWLGEAPVCYSCSHLKAIIANCNWLISELRQENADLKEKLSKIKEIYG